MFSRLAGLLARLVLVDWPGLVWLTLSRPTRRCLAKTFISRPPSAGPCFLACVQAACLPSQVKSAQPFRVCPAPSLLPGRVNSARRVKCARACQVCPGVSSVPGRVKCARACQVCPGVSSVPGRVKCARACQVCPGVSSVPGRVKCARACQLCPGVSTLPGRVNSARPLATMLPSRQESSYPSTRESMFCIEGMRGFVYRMTSHVASCF